MHLYGETNIQRCEIKYSNIPQKVSGGNKQPGAPNSSFTGIAYCLRPRTPGRVASFPIWDVVWPSSEQSPLISGHTCSVSPLAHRSYPELCVEAALIRRNHPNRVHTLQEMSTLLLSKFYVCCSFPGSWLLSHVPTLSHFF